MVGNWLFRTQTDAGRTTISNVSIAVADRREKPAFLLKNHVQSWLSRHVSLCFAALLNGQARFHKELVGVPGMSCTFDKPGRRSRRDLLMSGVWRSHCDWLADSGTGTSAVLPSRAGSWQPRHAIQPRIPGRKVLNHALSKHGIGHFDKSRHVGAVNIANRAVRLATVFQACVVNTAHDAVQTGIDFFPGPR